MTSLTRQMIAELFYILLFLVLFRKNMDPKIKWIFLICFGFGLVVSHYAISYIFLFLVSLTWLFGKFFMKNENLKISLAIVCFFFVLTFSWYTFVSPIPSERLALEFDKWFRAIFSEFFASQSRGAEVLSGLGLSEAPSFYHYIGRMFQYVAELFILIGFVSLIRKRKKETFDSEYLLVTSLNMIILLMCIIIPNFASSLGMDRLYHVSLLFLSPLFFLGCKTFFANAINLKKEEKRESYSSILILILLVTFFLFQVGFVYEITRDPVPSSISLSKYRMGDLPYDSDSIGLIHENDVFGAMWLSRYADVENTQTYSDTISKYHVLTSYSMIPNRDNIEVLSNTTFSVASGSYIYLRRNNVINELISYWPSKNIQYNISEIPIFNNTLFLNSKVYSNSACEIYHFVP